MTTDGNKAPPGGFAYDGPSLYARDKHRQREGGDAQSVRPRERIYDEGEKMESDVEVVRVKVKRKPRFISLWSQRG